MKTLSIICYSKHSPPPSPLRIWRSPSPSTGGLSSASNPKRFLLALSAGSLNGAPEKLWVIDLAGILNDDGSGGRWCR